MRGVEERKDGHVEDRNGKLGQSPRGKRDGLLSIG